MSTDKQTILNRTLDMAQQRMSVSPCKQISGNMTVKVNLDNNVTEKKHSTNDLQTLMSFLCDKQTTEMTKVIKSSIEVFKYCIPSRAAVLTFYRELFDEYSTYYWILQKRSLASNNDPNKGRIEYTGELTRRFYEMAQLKLADAREDQQSECDGILMKGASPTKSASSIAGPASPTCSQNCSSPTPGPRIIPTTPKVIPVSRRTSSCNSNNMDQTPMSPSNANIVCNMDNEYDSDIDVIDIFHELEDMISLIRSAIDDLIQKYILNDNVTSSTSLNNETNYPDKKRDHFRNILVKWASDLLIHLELKHCEIATRVANESNKSAPTNQLAKEIELRLRNPVYKLLVNVLLRSHNRIQNLFKILINSGQSWDWFLAHILSELSINSDCGEEFSSCMEYIINCQSAAKSVTVILAYFSDTNPKAMAKFPKSNIPFLISLCQTSPSLLSVLAQEIPDTINPEFLNKLAEEVYEKSSNSQPPCISSLAHCIMSAPNSYKLFILAMEVEHDDRVNPHVKSAAQSIISSISNKIQERAMTAYRLHIDNLLDQIKSDPNKLIEKSYGSNLVAKKAQVIFYRMSLIYGHLFASEIIGHYLNLAEDSFWLLLRPLLNKFMKQFGDDGSTLVSQTLSLGPKLVTATYWQNINSLIKVRPTLKMDLNLISQLLVDKLSAANLDLRSVAQLIKLCLNSLQQVSPDKIRISTKYRLCTALATYFYLLLETENENFPEILSYIRMSLTCMSLLKQSNIASHMLCRALLERSLEYKHLFNNNEVYTTNDEMKYLTKENLKVTLGHRFRRLPNIKYHNQSKNNNKESTQPDKQSINCYLLTEAFKSSINDIEAFATLFVEFLCPVMFDKNSWPSDDALRTINEKNLGILKRFEQIPPLWDLYELIGQAGCLKSCLVLVKALFAAHLALWASATTNISQDKMLSTARLIPPLALSNLVPQVFGLVIEVLPHLEANEVFSVLSDIFQYLKDTNEQKEVPSIKAYLNRLRVFMCQKTPGPLYVKIFKDLSDKIN